MKTLEEILPLVVNSTERVVSIASTNNALAYLLLPGNFAATAVGKDGSRMFYTPDNALEMVEEYHEEMCALSAAILWRLVDDREETREKRVLAMSTLFGPISLFVCLWRFAEVVQPLEIPARLLDCENWVLCEYSGKIAFVLEVVGERVVVFVDADCIRGIVEKMPPNTKKAVAQQVTDALTNMVDFLLSSHGKSCF